MKITIANDMIIINKLQQNPDDKLKKQNKTNRIYITPTRVYYVKCVKHCFHVRLETVQRLRETEKLTISRNIFMLRIIREIGKMIISRRGITFMHYDFFTGRKKELQDLNTLLTKKTASLVVIRGRRRIGKSRLIDKFAEGKPYFVFTGLPPEKETTAQSQREEFARQLRLKFGIVGLKADDWGDLFTMLYQSLPDGRVVLLCAFAETNHAPVKVNLDMDRRERE